VTRVDPLRGFFAAEDYHQDYLYLHPSQPYIAYIDIPKVNALKHIFPDIYLQQPTLVSAVNALKQR
jgi:peptide-methionine (S)-S-oxide reductase